MIDHALTPGGQVMVYRVRVSKVNSSLRCRAQRTVAHLDETWPKSRRPTCQMQKKRGQPIDRLSFASRGQLLDAEKVRQA